MDLPADDGDGPCGRSGRDAAVPRRSERPRGCGGPGSWGPVPFGSARSEGTSSIDFPVDRMSSADRLMVSSGRQVEAIGRSDPLAMFAGVRARPDRSWILSSDDVSSSSSGRAGLVYFLGALYVEVPERPLNSRRRSSRCRWDGHRGRRHRGTSCRIRYARVAGSCSSGLSIACRLRDGVRRRRFLCFAAAVRGGGGAQPKGRPGPPAHRSPKISFRDRSRSSSLRRRSRSERSRVSFIRRSWSS